MIIMFRIQLCRNGDDTMELEMDVEDLLNKRKLESDRIEFKAGWNPELTVILGKQLSSLI